MSRHVKASTAVVLGLVAWRLLLAFAIRTAFDPDEYWQAPEVAHRLVFGCGHAAADVMMGMHLC